MIKKMLRTATATLAVTSIFAMTAFASDSYVMDTNGGEFTAEGNAWMTEPVIEVELPGDLTFGINPLKLDADENPETDDAQIISGEYLITNYSNVPVLITAATQVEAGSNIELIASPTFDKTSKELKTTQDGKKGLWLFQLLPTKPTVIGEEGIALSVNEIDFAKEISGTSTATISSSVLDKKGKTLAGSGSTSMFMLKKYAEEDGVMKPECVSGFKFSGAVDPTKAFSPEDEKDAVKVKTTFTLKVLSAGEAAYGYAAATNFDSTVVNAK